MHSERSGLKSERSGGNDDVSTLFAQNLASSGAVATEAQQDKV